MTTPQDDPARSYSVEEFIIRGSDTTGSYERVFCRVMPGEYLQITRIIAAKVFPYKGIGDLFRHRRMVNRRGR